MFIICKTHFSSGRKMETTLVLSKVCFQEKYYERVMIFKDNAVGIRSITIKRKNSVSIRTALVYFFILIVLTPLFYDKLLIVACIIGLVFFVFTFHSFCSFVINNRLVRCTFALFFVEIVYRGIGFSSADIGNYAIKFLILTSVWMGVFVDHFLDEREHKSIVLFSGFVIWVNIVYNVIVYSTHPELKGVSTTTQFFLKEYGNWNIATTAFYYLVAFQAINYLSMSFLALNNKEKSHNSFLCLLSSLFIFFYSNTATIIITYLFIVLFFLSFVREKSFYNRVLICMIIFVLVVMAILLIQSSGFMGNSFFDIFGQKVATRITVLSRWLSGKLDQEDLTYLARFDFITLDIKTWLTGFRSFIFGNGYHTVESSSADLSALANGDGGHSMLIDLIARYGLLGLVFDVSLIIACFKYIDIRHNHQRKAMYNSIVIFFLVNNILNNCNSPCICLFIIVCISFCFRKKELSNDQF